MGFVQNTRQRLGSAAHFVGRHAATAGKAALTAAVVAGAAYNAYHGHADQQARDAQANWQAERGRERFEELLKHHRREPMPPGYDPFANHGGPTPSFIVPVKYDR